MKPIGVFDSGIGGLTVVRALRELLPNENIFYLGDTARVPYGNKSAETVERYSLELARILMARKCETDCCRLQYRFVGRNSKTASRRLVPVIGVIEPGAHAAIAMTRNRHVGVIGTRATIRSGAYENALRALNVHVRVSSVACPLLVPLIEEGLLDDKLTDLTIERYLNPMVADGIDTLVLGCTHYPLLTARDRSVPGRQNSDCRFRHELCASSQRFAGSTIARHHVDFRWKVGCSVNRRRRSFSQHRTRRFAATARRGAAACGLVERLARGRLCTTKS